MRRVVVTGLGMVSPLSSSVNGTWENLLNGFSAADKITRFDTDGFTTDYACEIKLIRAPGIKKGETLLGPFSFICMAV